MYGPMLKDDPDFYKMFGNLADEYDIYVTAAKDLNWPIKTFDEWLNS
jgi:hypothetical protein